MAGRDEILAILRNAGVDPATVAMVDGALGDSGRMEIIRDAFLCGRDLEAIGLIRELDPLRQITILPMSSSSGSAIYPTQVAQIVSRSQIGPFRARRLYVSKETGRSFDILDIKIANRSYFAQAGSIPAEPFIGPTIDASIVPDKDGAIVVRLSEEIDKHLGIDLDLPLARTAMDITLIVACKSPSEYGVVFEGFLWGHCEPWHADRFESVSFEPAIVGTAAV